jgi:16S rRNA (guanine966-N2)-methyltransferase
LGRLRIIAGRLKGRRIVVPRNAELRPTADRVREALFSILGGSVEGARVLDLFSGTGALGLEALSRGAAEVVFVEADGGVIRALEQTVVELDAGAICRVVHGDVVTSLERGTITGPFDLVLADPPYGEGLVDQFLGILGRGAWVSPGGRVVVERPLREPTTSLAGEVLGWHRSARYGATRLDFYQRPDGA